MKSMFVKPVWSQTGLVPLGPTAYRLQPSRSDSLPKRRERKAGEAGGPATGLRGPTSAARVLFAKQTCAGAPGPFSRVRLSLDVSITGFLFGFQQSLSPAFLASFYVNSGVLLAESELCFVFFFFGSSVAFGRNRLEISSWRPRHTSQLRNHTGAVLRRPPRLGAARMKFITVTWASSAS